tara:strand:- start:651 stop:1427 length:777 start_codon:yes stop_codon:yes gene_type:complete
MNTNQIIIKMLTENTGCHMLDSGGTSGRHWQRNQERDFESEPSTTSEFSISNYKGESSLDVQITHNIYHWLTDRLEYSERVDDIFQWFCKRKPQADLYWDRCIENFTRDRESMCDSTPMGGYTYNDQALLSQDIVFNQFSHDYIDYAIIQIHNGADARGGFTSPRVFECDESLFDYCRATLYAPNTLDPAQLIMPFGTDDNSHSWYSDDGYNFYGNDCNDLKSYNVTDNPDERGQGLVFVEYDKAYSPINGSQLEASE